MISVPGAAALFDVFATAEQGMKQGKQFLFLTSSNKESGYESEKIALTRLASPPTFFGVRSSRIHFSPTVRGGAGPWGWMNAWRTNPNAKDVCGEAIALQDQVISWVTTVDYRVKDTSWNGLNNHVSKIHLNISFRLKEILKNCVIVFPLPRFSSTIQPEQVQCYNYQKYWGEDETWTRGPWTPTLGRGLGTPVMDRIRGQFFF